MFALQNIRDIIQKYNFYSDVLKVLHHLYFYPCIWFLSLSLSVTLHCQQKSLPLKVHQPSLLFEFMYFFCIFMFSYHWTMT